ncbi:hypothetical protein BDP81DRAFT_421051 [Colletotrichum phormii]|uniref:Uncharacterized protein n=1 Tax=Colletotrichum phormii TaxID=359342 RepID=A0AAI9ZWF7_9PEZI|nr:uncharacterized protein BDP81DRAFT_421051 [Colletotrichum phormii]KAK1639470.1 hypothetical protein BDP81DRAFT_421051 [Colletotrichum phormii]
MQAMAAFASSVHGSRFLGFWVLEVSSAELAPMSCSSEASRKRDKMFLVILRLSGFSLYCARVRVWCVFVCVSGRGKATHSKKIGGSQSRKEETTLP